MSDDTAARPINLTDWQSQLRATKQQERLKRHESAQILHGYRGSDLREEDLKLAQLRAADRQKQLEAAETLHQYRSSADELGRSSSHRERRPQAAYPAPEKPMQEDMEAMIAQGSVSAKKAAFDSPMQAVTKTSRTEWNDNVTARPPLFTKEEQEEKKTETTPPSLSADQPFFDQEPQSSEAPVEFEATTAAVREEPEAATAAPIDVIFSFGLITASSTPQFDAYLEAVDQVTRATMAGQEIDYPSGPHVMDWKWDDSFHDANGRGNVQRAVVTVAVPLIVQTGTESASMRERLLAGMRQAIQSGELLARAQPHGI